MKNWVLLSSASISGCMFCSELFIINLWRFDLIQLLFQLHVEKLLRGKSINEYSIFIGFNSWNVKSHIYKNFEHIIRNVINSNSIKLV